MCIRDSYKEKLSIHLTNPGRKIVIHHNRKDLACDPTRVVVSNLCLCADNGVGDHFYAYYDLLAAPKRKPKITHQERPGGINPLVDPEHCFETIFRF